MSVSSGDGDRDRPPVLLEMLEDESRGSSVSSTLRNEYEQLMKYVDIVPQSILTPNRETSRSKNKLTKKHDTTSDGEASVNKTSRRSWDDIMSSSRIANESKTSVTNDTENLKRSHPPTHQVLLPPSTPAGVRNGGQLVSLEVVGDLPASLDRCNSSHFDLEAKLDRWCSELKHNLLDHYESTQAKMIHNQKSLVDQAGKKYLREKHVLVCEIDELKEKLALSEKSVHESALTISGLQTIIKSHNAKVGAAKHFYNWRCQVNDSKREHLCNKIASSHYNRKLLMRSWAIWHGAIRFKWRERLEKVCQAHAQQVCRQLEEKYEAQLAAMEESLNDSRCEVNKMISERNDYEENMKQAFLRGLSTLNEEASSIFQNSQQRHDNLQTTSNVLNPTPTLLTNNVDLTATLPYGGGDAVGVMMDVSPIPLPHKTSRTPAPPDSARSLASSNNSLGDKNTSQYNPGPPATYRTNTTPHGHSQSKRNTSSNGPGTTAVSARQKKSVFIEKHQPTMISKTPVSHTALPVVKSSRPNSFSIN